MSDQKYNGWTNYETWNFKLWLDNDEKTQKWFEEKLKDSISSLSDRGKIKSIDKLSEILKNYAWDNVPIIEASFYSDIMTASIRMVNFREIATVCLEDEWRTLKVA